MWHARMSSVHNDIVETKLNEVEPYCKSYLHGPQMSVLCKNRCLGLVDVLQFKFCSQSSPLVVAFIVLNAALDNTTTASRAKEESFLHG